MSKQFCLAFLLIFSFVAASSANPLDGIRRSLMREKRAEHVPIIVFNIDGTIFDNRPRSEAILRDFVAENCDPNSPLRDSFAALSKDSMEYYVVDSCKKVGITDLFVVEAVLRFWAERFFSDNYVNKDIPYDGAVEFINEMHDSGALIVYLSGRAQGKMLAGTVTTLRDAGFPIATPRSMIILKDDPLESASAYKDRAMREISGIGRVIAAFDNDPRSVNAMKKTWPMARVIMIQSQHEPQTTPLESGVEAIESYRP